MSFLIWTKSTFLQRFLIKVILVISYVVNLIIYADSY